MFLLWAVVLVPSGSAGDSAAAESRFRPLDVYIDPGGVPLAAYQIEMIDLESAARIVGIEGGAHPAFADPPYYDAAALQGRRVILAAFSTARDLPRGRTRVATVHVHETADRMPRYQARLQVAATTGGKNIPATVTITGR